MANPSIERKRPGKPGLMSLISNVAPSNHHVAIAMPIRYSSLLALALAYSSAAVIAQSLPAPSRTAFKCEVNGKVTYSDAPCLGAKKVELEPTRGLNSGVGAVLPGKDVRREREREILAEAIQPLTGMDSKQHETFGRRFKLPPDVKQACSKLDRQIPSAEAEEKGAAKADLPPLQSKLLVLRSKYRELKC